MFSIDDALCKRRVRTSDIRAADGETGHEVIVFTG